MFRTSPDYENPADMGGNNTYMVTVTAGAGGIMDMVDVTVTVTNEEEMGTVTLSPTTARIDGMITATLSDPDLVVDSSVGWQWQKSMDMASWMDITGANTNTYTAMATDEGYYLRAYASYTDGFGPGTAMMATSNTATAGDPLVNRYDADGNGTIEKSEVIQAINDYLFDDGEEPITKAEVIQLINLYLFSAANPRDAQASAGMEGPVCFGKRDLPLFQQTRRQGRRDSAHKPIISSPNSRGHQAQYRKGRSRLLRRRIMPAQQTGPSDCPMNPSAGAT